MRIYLLHNGSITLPDSVFFYPELCSIVYRFIHFHGGS